MTKIPADRLKNIFSISTLPYILLTSCAILPTSLGEKGTPFESRLIILLSVCILAEFFQCFPQLCGKYQEPYEWLAVSPHCHPSHYVAGTVTLGANSRSLETRIGAVGLFISILAIFYIINWRGGTLR